VSYVACSTTQIGQYLLIIGSISLQKELNCLDLQKTSTFIRWKIFAGFNGSRDMLREAFQKGFIHNGELWMETIKSRNKTIDRFLFGNKLFFL
jgi:hypothetical protein